MVNSFLSLLDAHGLKIYFVYIDFDLTSWSKELFVPFFPPKKKKKFYLAFNGLMVLNY